MAESMAYQWGFAEGGAASGYDFLCRAVSARFGQLLRFTESVDARHLPHEPLLEPELLGKEALTTIVVGIAEILKTETAFVVPGFLTFEAPAADKMAANLAGSTEALLKAGILYRHEHLDALLGSEPEDYWHRAFERDQDTAAVRSVIIDVLTSIRKREGRPIVPLPGRDGIAAIAVLSFFAALLNALALSRTVRVGGLGALHYRGEPRLAFEPDRPLRESVEVRQLRSRGVKEVEPAFAFAGGEEYGRVDDAAVEKETHEDLVEAAGHGSPRAGAVGALLQLLRAFHRRSSGR